MICIKISIKILSGTYSSLDNFMDKYMQALYKNITIFCDWLVLRNTNTTTTNNSSLQHQTAWDQHSYAGSSSNLIYSRLPSLHPPRKFTFPFNLSLQDPPTPTGDDLLRFRKCKNKMRMIKTSSRKRRGEKMEKQAKTTQIELNMLVLS